jgi:hypothetical protein
MHPAIRDIGFFVALSMFGLGIQAAHATEKYAIAAEAKVVVAGKLFNAARTETSRGWRLDGVIVPSEVLYGTTDPKQGLKFRFLCSCCQKTPARQVDAITKNMGLWFLIPAEGNRWTSAGTCSDPGWRPMADRSAYMDFFNKRR